MPLNENTVSERGLMLYSFLPSSPSLVLHYGSLEAPRGGGGGGFLYGKTAEVLVVACEEFVNDQQYLGLSAASRIIPSKRD